MIRGDTCYTCRFWLGQGVRERGPKGACRRFPPVVTDRAPAGTFPTTLTTDWCGEWRRHEGVRDDIPDEAKADPFLPSRPAAPPPQPVPGKPQPPRAERTLYDDL